MDPWAEVDWLERLRVFTTNRTTVMITHRLTTAMRADTIFVMADGQVVESGSHDELIQQGGLYAQSWERQILSKCLAPSWTSWPPFGPSHGAPVRPP